jgi:acetoin utilization protein AcuB
MMNEPISSIMNTDVVTVTPDDTLAHALSLFLEKKIQHIPVVVGPKMVGILSKTDLLKFLLHHSIEQTESTKVNDVMTKKVAFLEPEDHIGAASEVFMEHLFHAIPVCKDDHVLVGLVTSFDLLAYSYSKEYPPRD